MFKSLYTFLKAIFVGLCIGTIVILLIPNTRNAILDSVKQWLTIHNTQVSYSYAIKRSAPAVVNIYSISQYRNAANQIENKRQGLGSGVIMSSNGIILTNLHVIKGADIIYVALQDGRKGTASIIGTDPLTDLAVLHIEAENLPVIPFNLDTSTQVGDLVLAIGNPYNLGQTITQGIVSATGRRAGLSSSSFLDLLQTDAAINDGNSGGALINSRGELIGINAASFNSINDGNSNGISFAIPVKLAYSILKEIVVEGHILRGSVKFDGEQLDSNFVKMSLNIESGAIGVTHVLAQGPAGLAGLQVNDIIFAVNGSPFNNIKDLLHTIAGTKPGNDISLTVLRGNQELILNMKTTVY